MGNDKFNSLDHFISCIKDNPYYISKVSRFAIVDRFKALKAITQLCAQLDVSTSGYYKWVKRNKLPNSDATIVSQMVELQKENNNNLGYRTMKIKLEEKDTILSESKVYRLMKKYGLMSNALYTKKNKIIVKAIHSYTNQLKGDFSSDLPNIKWCIDMSKIKTDEGAVYICALIDLYDRLIVNYKIFNTQNTRLVKSTIDEALKKHKIDQETPILLQSDHGSQFTNNQYYNYTKENNIKPSMASKGTPTENAVIESFFATLKVECVYKYKFKTKEEAIITIKEFIEYYNNGRIQLKTGLTPMEIRDSFYNKDIA